MILGLTILDLIILGLYIGGILLIGIKSSFTIKNEEDYFLGARKFGKLLSTFASFGQSTSADGPTGVATTTFNNGISGIWSSMLMLFATPFFWITTPWLRRLRITTMGDFYRIRYGSQKMAAVYALVGTIGMMGFVSVGFKAVSTTTMAMTPKPVEELTTQELKEKSDAERLFLLERKNFDYLSNKEQSELAKLRLTEPRALYSYFSEPELIWCICIIIIIYTTLGGLEAAFYSDLLQGIFIILLSIILIPFSWMQINKSFGGSGILQAFNHLHERLPERFFEIFGSPSNLDFTWYYIITVATVSAMTVVTQPHQLVIASAAKDEYAARVGAVVGTFMKRFMTILWGVVGLSAVLLFSVDLINPDMLWGHATREILGPLNLGLVGLMLASLMAALMSTADCVMLTVSGLIVNNLYRPLFPQKTTSNYLWVGRITGAVFIIGAAIISIQFDNIFQILKFIWEFFVIFVGAFWLGLKWKKANRSSAWTSILTTLSLFYLIPLLIPIFFPSVRTNRELLKCTNPIVVNGKYKAKQLDVEIRNSLIGEWNSLSETKKSDIEKPESIELGDHIEDKYSLPPKSIYWSKGIKQHEGGNEYGSGYLYIEMILLSQLGFDLEQNPYALNETIRLIIRLVFPFMILMISALIMKPDDPNVALKFYQNMQNPVLSNRLGVGKKLLLFPNSDWEFYKWSKQDVYGFVLSCIMVFVILIILLLFVSIGSNS